MAATAESELTGGPVLSFINKRIRGLRKKQNRIRQMEEAIAQGKPINKEQEEVLRSKPYLIAAIEELEKLREPLSVAVSEEINLAIQHHQVSTAEPVAIETKEQENDAKKSEIGNREIRQDTVVEDLLNLLYFGSMFDVKPQSDFTATMLTRTHERGCCLTYDYVTDDDANDLLGERDLDLISSLGGLLISRPVDSNLSHKNALQRCIEHAKLWIANSDEPIDSNSNVTYAGLREKLTKIMASDYFTTTPEMKAPVEMAAAGNYGSFQVPVHEQVMPVDEPAQVEASAVEYQEKEEDTTNSEGAETLSHQSTPVEAQKGGSEVEDHGDVITETEPFKTEVEEVENPKDQQYVPRRSFQNRSGRGGGGGGNGGGRRGGYSNGRGGRSGGRGGGPYQNGRSQYYDQPGNYYPRNYYNNRGGRGGGGGRGNGAAAGGSYSHHGLAGQTGYAQPQS